MQITQDQLKQYEITFISIKMNVKFTCKMKLQSKGSDLTEQVSINQYNKFIFNKQLIIKGDINTQFFDIDVVLITDRGARYVSALIKLPLNQLQKSQGQIITCPLTKCLDLEAFSQIKVNKFKNIKLKKRVSVSSTLIDLKKQLNNDNNNKNNNNNNNKINQNNKFTENDKKSSILSKQQSIYQSPKIKRSQINETKSEIGNKAKSPIIHRDWDDKSKGPAQTLIYKSSFLKSPNRRTIALGSPRLQNQYHDQDISPGKNIDKLSQSQVYRQGYQKLKQKYKRQSQLLKSQQNKRIQLQGLQNSYKIQIMRLKLKIQQQQRLLIQKNDRIKELQLNNTQINKNNLNLQCLKQQNNNLEHIIQQFKDTVTVLNKQNDSYKRLNQDNIKSRQSIIASLRQQLEQTKTINSGLSIQLTTKQKQTMLQLNLLKQELQSKATLIEMQKTQIYKLQTHADNKLFDFEKTMQNQKNNNNQKVNQLRQKISILQRQIKQRQNQTQQEKRDKDKLKQIILKLQYDNKILLQEHKIYKNSLLQSKNIKQKNMELQKQLSFILCDKLSLQKQVESISQSKDMNVSEINSSYQIKLQYYKKELKQFQQKYQCISGLKIELQSQLQLSKHDNDKNRRQIQSLQKQTGQYKKQQNRYRTYVNELQKQNLSNRNQISLMSNKLRFNESTSKNQYDKISDLLQKNKIQLNGINTKYNMIYDQKANLQIEYSKNKILLQYAEEKYQKLCVANKQIQSIYQTHKNQHDVQQKQYQNFITKKEQQIKKINQIISKHQLSLLQSNSNCDKMRKQLKLGQEKYQILDNLVKNKNNQILQSQQQYQQLQIKLLSLDNNNNNLKHQNNLLLNEKNKILKILQLKNQSIQLNKQTYNKIMEQKQKLQQIQLNLRQQIKKNNQNYAKLQTKLKYSDKQYNKFKDQLFKTIKIQYSKIPTLSLNKNDNKDSTQRNKQSQVTSIMKINTISNNNNNSNKQSGLLMTETTSLNNLQQIKQLSLGFPIVSGTTSSLQGNDLLNELTQHINTTKQTTFKLIEHNKQLKKQLTNLQSSQQNQSQKHIISQSELQKDIEHLSNQLNQLYNEKKQEIMNYDFQLQQLNRIIYEKDHLIQSLTKQCQQLEYVLASLRQDFELNNQQNNKKVNILKVSIYELQQKLQYYRQTLQKEQDKKLQTQQKYKLYKQKTQQQQSQINKLKVIIENYKLSKINIQNQLSISLKQRKQLIQKCNQLQHKFTQTLEQKQRQNISLQTQEQKIKQLKQFISTIMKQKQTIIRSQLQKSDKILQLQTKQIQLKRDLLIYQQQCKKYEIINDELKQKNKKEKIIFKSQQMQINELKNKVKKTNQKADQKQKQIILKSEIISKLDLKYRQLAQKNYKQSSDLHNQIDSKNYQNMNITKQLNSKLILLQARIQQYEHNKARQHHEHMQLSEQLLCKNEQIQTLRRQKNGFQSRLGQIEQQYRILQQNYNKIDYKLSIQQQQNKILDNNIRQIQEQLQQQRGISQVRIQQLDKRWLQKYQILIEQQQQKAQILQNQNQIIRSQLQSNIKELQFLFKQNKHNQVDILEIRKSYEDKIKNIQNSHLNSIINKNNQIKKMQALNKQLLTNNNQSDRSFKQTSELLENMRKRLQIQQKHKKQLQQKLKSLIAISSMQTQTWRKKHSQNRLQIQKLYQSIFSNEREVRKVVQGYIKKVLDECDKTNIDRITNATRGLQNMIVVAMNNNISTVKV